MWLLAPNTCLRLADTHMSDLTPFTPVIERGIGLHKLIRLVSRVPNLRLIYHTENL